MVGGVGKLGSLGYSALRERKGVSGDREQKEGGKEGRGRKEEVGEGQTRCSSPFANKSISVI